MGIQNNDLMELFMQLEPMLHRYFAVRHHGAFENPHRGQGRVISILKMKPQISQRELTYLLGMSKQALGELLSKLESCGYITRTPSEDDGRVMMVSLTDKGKEASEELEENDNATDALFGCLTDEEQKNLYDYLQRLIAQCQKEFPDRERMRPYGFGRRSSPDFFGGRYRGE